LKHLLLLLLQKRTCSTLSAFLVDEKSDETLQRNVLKLLLNLLPTCPKRDDDQKVLMSAIDTLAAKKNNTESVMMMLGSAKRNIMRLRDDGQQPTGNTDNFDAEDGEVRSIPSRHVCSLRSVSSCQSSLHKLK
jgi:hypothetical protein